MEESKFHPEGVLEDLKSKALVDNLALTRVASIEIPPDALWLLGLSMDYFGIHQRFRAFLDELYHPFANLELALNLMRQSLIPDLWLYARHPERDRAVSVIFSLVDRMRSLAQSKALRKRLLQEYLELVSALAEFGEIPQHLYFGALAFLEDWAGEEPGLFTHASGYCRKSLFKVIRRLDSEDSREFEARAGDFLLAQLAGSLAEWEAMTDIENWHARLQDPLLPQVEKLSGQIGKAYFQRLKSELQAATRSSDLEKIPSYGEIAALHRSLIGSFTGLNARIHYIFYLLALPGMADLSDHLLWDLNRQLADLQNAMNPHQIMLLLDSVFDSLKGFRATHQSIVLDCVLTIGRAVISTQDGELIQRCVRKTIDLGFVPPGKVEINKEWQICADKNHIKNIRVWLELIGMDMPRTEELLSALIINLTVKGVFISDTDLFQKDVSQFLNSDIKPYFVQVKHLLRLFPVFFNEIGAEGEIRDYTTAIDEMSGRSDRLIHFLRKQVHTESNNTHINLVRQIMWFWHDLDPSHLDGIIPADVAFYISQPDGQTQAQHRFLRSFLDKKGLDPDKLLNLSWQRVSRLFGEFGENPGYEQKRLINLCHIYYLLLDKYNLDPYDIVKFLKRYPFFDQKAEYKLQQALRRADYESAIRQMLEYIGILNGVILDPKPSQGWENIYYKRHIAAGIPSMYGQYREPKLEAFGMIFRLENVIKRLIERHVAQINLSYISAKILKRIVRVMELIHLVLQHEGINNEAFGSALEMLKSSRQIATLSLNQYRDIFQLLKDSINEIIDEYFYRFYDHEFELGIISPPGTPKSVIQKQAEEFYRKLLSSSFLVQELDNFTAQIILSLNNMKSIFQPEDVRRVMSYDPDRLFIHLDSRDTRGENQVLLGSKGFFLKRMHRYEFPIPPGFVITTELFSHRGVISAHPDISSELDEYLRHNVGLLEARTGLGFGNPQSPLLFSARSGAAMSLPGAMNTFLNIGMNDEITESLSHKHNFGWTAWDCYRRLIQSWGMAYNIDRDEFDAVMIEYKNRHGVSLKTQFTPEQMKQMCADYKQVLAGHGIEMQQDPFLQLKQAIVHVLDSWNTERARLYRQKMHIADEWGTAVIVQRMVLGNISPDSGTGVLFTHSVHSKKPGINLNGDFTLCSQGEDVVAGLVHTLPISEAQRERSKSDPGKSLEADFPLIYNRLERIARQLIEERGYPHQEIEFTFEGHQEEQLFILQTRNQVIAKSREYTVFNTPKQDLQLIGRGIGIGKGVLNGLVAFSREDIDSLKESGLPIILVRPDTVPDDMDLLFDCQGLLTARGGVTSHAAVTASRLGIIGIVNCRELKVFEAKSHCRIGTVNLRNGDAIALDAGSGGIYLGHYPVEKIRV